MKFKIAIDTNMCITRNKERERERMSKGIKSTFV